MKLSIDWMKGNKVMKTKEMLIELLNNPTKRYRHVSTNNIDKTIKYNYLAQILDGQLEIINRLSGYYVVSWDLEKEWVED